MGAMLTPATGAEASLERAKLDASLRAAGLTPRWWSNGPGDTYGEHDHPYHKVLYCQDGGIVFHTDDGDIAMEPGDRLDIEPHTRHGATVGAGGVVCVEAAR
ncbi:MAG: cupin domain-containing protein [Actinomycetota bacterium]